MPIFIQQNRALLRVDGADAATFLQGLITQDVTTLSPERWQWAGLLSAQGKILFDFLIRRCEDGYILDVEAARCTELIKKFSLYKLRATVNFEVIPAPVLIGWDVPMPHNAALDARNLELGWRGSGDAPTATTQAYRQHRWSLGIAEGAEELGIGQIMWLEANANELGGANFTKGCYVGQENTARMYHRSKLRKRLFSFQSCGSGGELVADDKAAGDIMCHQNDCGIALMRLEHIECQLTLGNMPLSLLRPIWLEAQLKND
jgi:folate-binding protein YgfZ